MPFARPVLTVRQSSDQLSQGQQLSAMGESGVEAQLCVAPSGTEGVDDLVPVFAAGGTAVRCGRGAAVG